MVYKTFLNQVAANIQMSLGEHCRVSLERVRKNNGLLLDGICIEQPGDLIAPTIYLNSYYQEYEKGRPLEEICHLVLETYWSRCSFPHLDPSMFRDFDRLRDKVVYRLINAQSNQELLDEIPYIPYLDLAVIFCIYLVENEKEQMTALIRNSHLKLWDITIQDLEECGAQNTPRLLPCTVKSLSQVIMESSSDPEEPLIQSPDFFDSKEDFYDFPLYVLTNQKNLYGAACIRYPDAIKNFADSRNSDVLILPSSIHEVLITADTPEVDYDLISHIVFDINQSDVPVEDRLSNQVYRYCRQDGSFSIVSHCPESV